MRRQRMPSMRASSPKARVVTSRASRRAPSSATAAPPLASKRVPQAGQWSCSATPGCHPMEAPQAGQASASAAPFR